MARISEKTKRIGIIVIAALMVEAISVIQYRQLRQMVDKDMQTRARIVTNSISRNVRYNLELTEATMRENMWDIRRSLSNPDCTYNAIERLIDDNPNVVGGFLAFIPDYFPSEGYYFEPYVHKRGDKYIKEQLAGADHDYTQHPAYLEALNSKSSLWSAPYLFEGDTMMRLITFSSPVTDNSGNTVAVCGLDMDISRLGDLINVNQHYASSFCMVLTKDGKLVATPSNTPEEEVAAVMDYLGGGNPKLKREIAHVAYSDMKDAPYWRVVQVYYRNEIYKPLKKLRLSQMILVLAGLLILFFMIERFARGENKLHAASVEQARIGRELSIANNIQKSMLPKTFPPGVFGSLTPAREVGGDLYDAFIRDNKLFFCIGDVSGKGVPSAMVMSITHVLFRMLAEKIDSPSRIMEILNKQGCKDNDSNMFVTFFVGMMDLSTGKMVYCNAGHDKPLLLNNLAMTLEAKPNFPLGIFPDTGYEEQQCTIEPGTTLFLYTDGLTEAKNPQREQFGRKRVVEALERFRSEGLTPRQMLTAISGAVEQFCEGAPQSDDLTMLFVDYDGPNPVLSDSLTICNDVKEVTRLGEFLKGFISQLAVDKKTAANMRLAVEETVVNCISYAYPDSESGEIAVEATADGRKASFRVVDSGLPFDPTLVKDADTSLDVESKPIGGLGILLARKTMDSIEYRRTDNKNELTLTKNIT